MSPHCSPISSQTRSPRQAMVTTIVLYGSSNSNKNALIEVRIIVCKIA